MAVIKKKLPVSTNKPKKQSLKKIQKTKDIKEAKKLTKQLARKAISEKLNRPQVIKKLKSKHRFDPSKLNRGIVLIKNLPHGFFEPQLKDYFSQYGKVTRLRLARSEQTGRSKAYAFVEFRYPEVAEIAAKTMDSYLMYRQIIKTAYIPPEKQRYDYFKQRITFQKLKDGGEKVWTPKIQRAENQVKQYNKPISNKEHADRVNRSKKKLRASQRQLAALGIDLDLSQVIYNPSGDKVLTQALAKGKTEKSKKGETNEKPEPSKNKKLEKPEKQSNKQKQQKQEKVVANKATKKRGIKGEENPNNGTLQEFLERINETIPSSEDDDDYTPSEAEVQKANKAATKLMQKLKSTEKNGDVETNSSDDSDDDDDINDLFDSDDDSDSDEENISIESDSDEEATGPALTNSNREIAKQQALAFAAKLSKNKKAKPSDTTESNEEKPEGNDSKKQSTKAKPTTAQKRKNTSTLQAPKKVQARQSFQVSEKTPEKSTANTRNKKQKLQSTNKTASIQASGTDVEHTPVKKPRTNFVTAPTPESTQKKAKTVNKGRVSAQKSAGKQQAKNIEHANRNVGGNTKAKQQRKGAKVNKK